MKRLIFGGSFNPVHKGHIALLKAISAMVEPDLTMIIPSYLPVHKAVGSDYAEASHRLAMCRLAFEAPDVEISDRELVQQRPCYTVETLTSLKGIYPEDEFYLACGSDMFLTFNQWRDYRRIYELAVICAVSRGDEMNDMLAFAKEQEALGMRYLLSEADPVVVSSTEVRERIRSGWSVKRLVPPAVLSYINEHGLYREEV